MFSQLSTVWTWYQIINSSSSSSNTQSITSNISRWISNSTWHLQVKLTRRTSILQTRTFNNLLPSSPNLLRILVWPILEAWKATLWPCHYTIKTCSTSLVKTRMEPLIVMSVEENHIWKPRSMVPIIRNWVRWDKRSNLQTYICKSWAMGPEKHRLSTSTCSTLWMSNLLVQLICTARLQLKDRPWTNKNMTTIRTSLACCS